MKRFVLETIVSTFSVGDPNLFRSRWVYMAAVDNLFILHQGTLYEAFSTSCSDDEPHRITLESYTDLLRRKGLIGSDDSAGCDITTAKHCYVSSPLVEIDSDTSIHQDGIRYPDFLESLCRLAAARGGLDALVSKKVMDLDEQQYYSALKYVINSF